MVSTSTGGGTAGSPVGDLRSPRRAATPPPAKKKKKPKKYGTLRRSWEQSSQGFLLKKSCQGKPRRLPGVNGVQSSGLQMLNASHMLVPALGSGEAEKTKKVFILIRDTI